MIAIRNKRFISWFWKDVIVNLFFPLLGFLPLILTILYNLDSLQDRFFGFFAKEEDVFDFIVVGAGSAGAVVANRLSVTYRVLLLEAGGDPSIFSNIPVFSIGLLNYPHYDWQFYTQPTKGACLGMKDQKCAWPRGKGLGGSSNLNFMIYMRGHPEDYNQWAAYVNDKRWEYNNVLRFFKKSENYEGEWDTPLIHSKDGELRVKLPNYFTPLIDIYTDAAEEKGYPRVDVNGNFSEGFSPIYNTEGDDGSRFSTYRAFLQPILDRKNLEIRKFSYVRKVILEGDKAPYKAVGVEYEKYGTIYTVRATKEVIVSCGTVQSPQVLMLSGIGPKKHLSDHGITPLVELPVGQNLQDHVTGFLGPFTISEPISLMANRDLNPAAFYRYFFKGTGAMTSTGVQAGGYFATKFEKRRANSRNTPVWPDIQHSMVGMGTFAAMSTQLERAFNVPYETLDKFLRPIYGYDSFMVINLLSRPASRGSIELASPNPSDYPLIFPNYFDKYIDMKVLIEGAKLAVEMCENTTSFKAVNCQLNPTPFPGCEHHELRSDAYWECYHRRYTLTLYHPTGTCAMGPDGGKNTVVDSQLRVLNVEGLRVMDASVMPIEPVGNTNAPTIMIAEMGANFILEHWRKLESDVVGSASTAG